MYAFVENEIKTWGGGYNLGWVGGCLNCCFKYFCRGQIEQRKSKIQKNGLNIIQG